MASNSDGTSSAGGKQESHANLLQLYCRICGRRNVKAPTPYIDKDNGVHFDNNPNYRSFLSRLHEVDVNGENGEIFPKRVCQLCVDLFRSGITVLVKPPEGTSGKQRNIAFFDLVKSLFICMRTQDMRELQNKFPLADFWAHSSSSFQGCTVCQDGGSGVDPTASGAYKVTTNTALPPGKKVKTLITVTNVSKEAGGSDFLADEGGEMYKVLEIKTGIVTVQVPPKPPAPKPAAAAGAAGPNKAAAAAAPASGSKPSQNGGSSEVEEVSVVKGKRPLSAGGQAGSGAAATPDTKKRKVEGGTPTPQPSSHANQWPAFNEILGQNRKYRADKLGELLNLYQFEVPKVLTDLASSGITYKPTGGKTHFVKNAEFRKSLQKCLNLLGKVPTPKKSLLMFRAITDTASDGQLSILSHVGINIDLTNPSLTFLLRRIRNSAGKTAEGGGKEGGSGGSTPNKKTKTVVDIGGGKKGGKAVAAGSGGKADGSTAQKSITTLPKGITISKVPTPSSSGTSTPSKPIKPGPKSKKKGYVDIVDDRPEIQSFGSRATPDDNPPILPVKLPTKTKPKLVALMTKLNNQWPANRQLRADVLRDVILSKEGSKKLLMARGVVFDQIGGGYHLRALSQQRGVHKKQLEKLTEKLDNNDWADLIVELVFDLLHPEDTLTLRIVGLFIDPLSFNAPLHFRMLFALKKNLKVDEDKEFSKNLMRRVLASVKQSAGDAPISDFDTVNGIVTLLYCDEAEAATILKNATGKAVKAGGGGGAASKPGPKSAKSAGPKPSVATLEPVAGPSGPRPRKTSYIGYDDDSDEDWDPKKKNREIAGGGASKRAKVEKADDDDYVPDADDADDMDDEFEPEVMPKSSKRRQLTTPVKYDDTDYMPRIKRESSDPAMAAAAGVAGAATMPLILGKRGRGRPKGSGAAFAGGPSSTLSVVGKKTGGKPITLSIKKKSSAFAITDVSVSLERINSALLPSPVATISPLTGPGSRGKRGPYKKKNKAGLAATAAAVQPRLLGGTGRGRGRPPRNTARLQPVNYEQGIVVDGGGAFSSADPLGDPLGDPLSGAFMMETAAAGVESDPFAADALAADPMAGVTVAASGGGGGQPMVEINDDMIKQEPVGPEDHVGQQHNQDPDGPPVSPPPMSPPASPPVGGVGEDGGVVVGGGGGGISTAAFEETDNLIDDPLPAAAATAAAATTTNPTNQSSTPTTAENSSSSVAAGAALDNTAAAGSTNTAGSEDNGDGASANATSAEKTFDAAVEEALAASSAVGGGGGGEEQLHGQSADPRDDAPNAATGQEPSEEMPQTDTFGDDAVNNGAMENGHVQQQSAPNVLDQALSLAGIGGDDDSTAAFDDAVASHAMEQQQPPHQEANGLDGHNAFSSSINDNPLANDVSETVAPAAGNSDVPMDDPFGDAAEPLATNGLAVGSNDDKSSPHLPHTNGDQGHPSMPAAHTTESEEDFLAELLGPAPVQPPQNSSEGVEHQQQTSVTNVSQQPPPPPPQNEVHQTDFAPF